MAKSTRSFSPNDIPQKQDDYHGGCRYFRTTPDMASKGLKSLNIELSFDNALRLSAAIQAAIMQMTRYDRREKGGKDMGLCLSVKEESSAISVIEVRLKNPKPANAPTPG